MRKPAWYVIQVQTGRERQACVAIERACAQAEELRQRASDEAEAEGEATDAALRQPLLEECFSPRYHTEYKLHGDWHDEEKLLLPGYVIAVTANPWRLARVLGGVSGLTRILKMGETFSPLHDIERDWIERWTAEGDRAIPMSVAYKEGDRVVVTEGPLKGHEAMIVRIRRRQSLAELEIHAGQVTVRATVGLAVLPEREEQNT